MPKTTQEKLAKLADGSVLLPNPWPLHHITPQKDASLEHYFSTLEQFHSLLSTIASAEFSMFLLNKQKREEESLKRKARLGFERMIFEAMDTG